MSDLRVGVAGCGLMGSGIAEVSARAGCDVVVREVDGAALDRGRRRIESSLRRADKSGKLGDLSVEDVLARIRFETEWDAFADRQVVVEAVVEAEAEKVEVFRSVDRVV